MDSDCGIVDISIIEIRALSSCLCFDRLPDRLRLKYGLPIVCYDFRVAVDGSPESPVIQGEIIVQELYTRNNSTRLVIYTVKVESVDIIMFPG